MSNDLTHLLPLHSRKNAFSPAQCRAARQLLGIRAIDLAEMSGVSIAAIKNFEQGACVPQERTLRDLREAFEKEGVSFSAAITQTNLTASVAISRPIQIS